MRLFITILFTAILFTSCSSKPEQIVTLPPFNTFDIRTQITASELADTVGRIPFTSEDTAMTQWLGIQHILTTNGYKIIKDL